MDLSEFEYEELVARGHEMIAHQREVHAKMRVVLRALKELPEDDKDRPQVREMVHELTERLATGPW